MASMVNILKSHPSQVIINYKNIIFQNKLSTPPAQYWEMADQIFLGKNSEGQSYFRQPIFGSRIF